MLIRSNDFLLQNHEYSGYGDEPRRKREDNNKPNHVLLFTIINPVYPITVVSIKESWGKSIFSARSIGIELQLTTPAMEKRKEKPRLQTNSTAISSRE
ncbi:hypothetical protein TSAR_016397 [Trichomalopsis sarcophagae]|uniref:Uncharacterized protein n=1 Tax=Trichomalopsis sarcophagae TaxID=543379 RepID=A0A232FK41_9HYME|nr:hypothetical protein TSAR_016397 [Trichomalopsis sarcophagae]